MSIFVGTSGYGYKEWKGSFYPEKLPQKQMLNYYGERLNSVELNHTFRRMPSVSSLESLAGQVPATFRFAVKAQQSITHFKRLKGTDADLQALIQGIGALNQQAGPALFQLPPNFKKDLERLDAFLALLARRVPAAFEFRHESWYSADVYDLLRQHSCVLCAADDEETPPVQLISTANWGYVRLRRDSYSKKELASWAKNIRDLKWSDTFVYFKHEDTGQGPVLAQTLHELLVD